MCCAKPPVISSSSIRAGLDIGSRASKLVALGPEGIILSRVMDSAPFVKALHENGGFDAKALGLKPKWPLVVTGLGRIALPGLPYISEIRAHFKGALAQSGKRDFTLVELGGQDSKVVHVKNGRVMDFITNDRCAAGTGRYLENMARLMQVELEELAGAINKPVQITNTCATFGETEILAHLMEGKKAAHILAGVNWSVARQIAQMVRRYEPTLIIFSGGVAHNRAVVELTGRAVGCPVEVLTEPQLNGALGCCMEEEPL